MKDYHCVNKFERNINFKTKVRASSLLKPKSL